MKKFILGLSLVLVLGVAVTGTLALFSSKTNAIDNTFTMGEGVSAELKEPGWDGIEFGTSTATNPNDPTLGKNVAKEFEPGEIIAKNPQIKNTSKTTKVVTAVAISYGGDTNDYTALSSFATIDFNETNWEFNTNRTVAYYKGTLAPGGKTEPVFNNVTIKKEATTDTLKNFVITVQGFVVQEDTTGGATAKSTLNAVYPELNK